jgi:hypothetical protein
MAPSFFYYLPEAENDIEEIGELLIERIWNQIKLVIWALQKAKMTFYVQSFPWKFVYLASPKWHFRSAKGTKWVSKESENYIAGSGENRNHRFPDMAHVAFLAV